MILGLTNVFAGFAKPCRWYAAAGLAALALAGLDGCAKKQDAAPPVHATTVDYAVVKSVSAPVQITGTGTIAAWQEVGRSARKRAASPPWPCSPTKARPSSRGQPLLKMDDVLLQAQVKQATANADQAKKAYDRAQTLFNQGYLSAAALDQAQASMLTTEAGKETAETQLSLATVRAPVSGYVTERKAVLGQIVQQGAELFKIVRDGRVELNMQVVESDLHNIKPGMAVTVTSQSAGQVTGNVRIVTSQVDPDTRLGIARVSVPWSSGLRPGMFASGSIDAGVQDVPYPAAIGHRLQRKRAGRAGGRFRQQGQPAQGHSRRPPRQRCGGQGRRQCRRQGRHHRLGLPEQWRYSQAGGLAAVGRRVIMSSSTAAPVDRGFQISSWSIRNPIPTLVFFVVMTIAGALGFQSLRINNWPDIDFPLVVVTVIRSGAAPEELQNQVTRIVEDSVAGLSGVRHTQSFVNESASTTLVTFQLDVDLEKATNDVRNAVAGIRGNLPGDIQDPIVSRVENAQGQALLSYIIRADNMNPEQLSWYVDNDVAKRIHSVKGVSSIDRAGGVDREIRIELDPAKLQALGVTAGDISNQLRSFNVNMPGGSFDAGTSEQTIRTMGNANSIAELADKRITLSNGTSVRLGDVGTVTDTWSRPTARARFNGNEVVGFGVERTRGTSEARVATAVRKVIAQLKADNPHIQIEQVASSVDDVNRSYDSSMESLVIGAALAVFVVWLFLRDWRATFVSAVAMPMSLLPTFFVMNALNQSLNVVTLLALSLTIGILVDDAIVEIENIVRHMREGKKPYPAAIEAADEIGLAVVATTATLIAVFAPTGFMPGIVGQFFKSFAIASCVSVFFSLVVARTLTPLMGAYLLRDKGTHDDKPFWMDGYQGLLKWCLEGRLKWRGFIMFHGVIAACVFGSMAAQKDSVAAAMPQLIGLAIALGVSILLGLIFSKAYVKVRWVVLEIFGLIALALGGMGFATLMGGLFKAGKLHMPAAAAAKMTAQMAAQDAAATAHGGHAMTAQAMMTMGGVFLLIGLVFLVIGLVLCLNLKTSFLNARWAVVIFGLAFLIGSVAMLVTIPQESIPASDNSMSVMSISLPPGSTLDQTDAVVLQAEKDLKSTVNGKPLFPEVVSSYASETAGSASVIVNLTPKNKRHRSQAEFEQAFSKILKTYPGVRASFGQQGGGGTGVAYILASDDGDKLNATAVELQREMASLPELANVQSADNLTKPEIQIVPKPDEAALMGVSTATISSAARVATVGDIDQILAKYNDGDRQIPIRVLMPYSAREGRQQPGQPDGADQVRYLGAAVGGGRYPLWRRPDPDQPHRPDARRHPVGRPQRRAPRARPMRRSPSCRSWKRSTRGEIPGVHTIVNPNTEDFVEMVPNFIVAILTGILLMYMVLVFAVRFVLAPGHHPDGPAGVVRRRVRRPDRLPHVNLDAQSDRADHADRHRCQELDPARRIRHGGHEGRTGRVEALMLAGAQASPSDRHDHGGHGAPA